MSKLVFDPLYAEQRALDEAIFARHAVSYDATREKRLLALYVEVGELANATRTFKFWSEKPSEPREAVLEEYADGLHFLLSLGLAQGISSFAYEPQAPAGALSAAFLKVYQAIAAFAAAKTAEAYAAAFASYLDLLPLLGATGEEAIAAYEAKRAVNYRRQETHY